MKKYGFTDREMKYVAPRKSRAQIERDFDYLDWFGSILLGAVFAGLIFGIGLSIYLLTDRAEASELRDNAYYCTEVQEGRMKVLEATQEQIDALCAEYI